MAMSATEPPLRDVLAALFARAALIGEATDISLSRGLHLRAAPTPPGGVRRLILWRTTSDTPVSMNEARICAEVANFAAYDSEWLKGSRSILLTERAMTSDEAREAERYRQEPTPAAPWIPGRELPLTGNLELNRLYHLQRPEGVYYLMIRANGPLQVHGYESVDVERGKAAHWLEQHGYTHSRITAGGYPL